jgi:hypothetical protein
MLSPGEIITLTMGPHGIKEYGPYIVRKEITNDVVQAFRQAIADPHPYSFRDWLEESGYLERYNPEGHTWHLGHFNEFQPDPLA